MRADAEDRHGLLPWFEPRDLDPVQALYYRALTTSPRATSIRTPLVDARGRLNGPFNPLLPAPEVGIALERLGASLRFPGRLPAITFESVVLIVASKRRAAYEWYAHAPLGLAAGLTAMQIDAVCRGDYDALVPSIPAQLVEIVAAALAHEEPRESAVIQLDSLIGAGAVTEVVVTAAYYDLLATVMRTWRSPMPSGIADPFDRD